MTQVYRFDHSSLSSAGDGLLDAAAEFERHTGNLLATMVNTGDTAWGGTPVGAAMDRLGDLLGDACGVLRLNLHRTGDGIRDMADDLRRAETDTYAGVQDAGIAGADRPV
ncbi:hypothetical protein HTZ77_08605 [Nonomuraea sp. SMC257]|uniref:ESX-1 secretion-associated protein n=1 Tax=Nonomuraea montanisoli TaxID=2741721 RepID=A0A7Y6I4D2_9ACTN|nr:hypothetical protein [Nonomuraea montanisoli]NUW31483.1 hypothetical protein [Nonomuraea montanisoli]